jgi:hypothetical protein
MRIDGLDAYGRITSRRYVWPDGYRYERGEEIPTADELRLMLVQSRRRSERDVTSITVGWPRPSSPKDGPPGGPR